MRCTTGHPAEPERAREHGQEVLPCPEVGGVARLAPVGQTENVVIHGGWTPNKGSLSHIYFYGKTATVFLQLWVKIAS